MWIWQALPFLKAKYNNTRMQGKDFKLQNPTNMQMKDFVGVVIFHDYI
jgi:hypothetical protein